MLFLLTGDVQIGKTRWLTSVVEDLVAADIPVAGVLAPGVWRKRCEDASPDGPGGSQGAGPFEKLGIDNVLLPSGTLVPFARRRDLALAEGTYDANSQSAAAKMAWEISDAAIARVNAHFDDLRHSIGEPALLVVDELGQLELLRGGGLTSAVALLDAGTTPQFPHAVVIVRDRLLEGAIERFSNKWDDIRAISPNDAGRDAIFACFGKPPC